MTLVVLLAIGSLAHIYNWIPGDSQPTASSTPKVTKPKPPSEPRITVLPKSVEQGEPAIIVVEGLATTTTVASFTFAGRPLNFFLYEGSVTAFLGVDLYAAPGTFPLVLTYKDGRQLQGKFVIEEREPVQRPFDIPEKLGGNTPASIQTLITTLAAEGKIINALPTTYKRLWTEPFHAPLDKMVLDDPYGYTRVIGAFTMPHKGTDFLAEVGTPVYAINKGVVKLATTFRNYGDTVIVDHGVGVHSVYMHLSKINVAVGETVEKGAVVGLTGETGYTTRPHLHLSVRIWDISIDPVKFLDLFGEDN